MKEDYRISASDYLLRAKHLLDEDKHELFFYAALELRCGIESRLREYLSHYNHIPKKSKKDWNLDNLDAACRRYLNTEDKIQRLAFIKPTGEVHIAHYVPLNKGLIANGQRLGNYLHDMKSFKPAEDKFWTDFRSLLILTYDDLCICCSGTLLSAGLKTGDKLITPLLTDDFFIEMGKKISLHVDYITMEDYLNYYKESVPKLRIT